MLRRGRHRGRGLRPRRAGEPVRARLRRPARGVHADRVARGPAAALRGRTTPTTTIAERAQTRSSARSGPITLAALGLVVLVATALLWVLTRRLTALRRGARAAAARGRRRLGRRAGPDRPRPARRRGAGPRRRLVRRLARLARDHDAADGRPRGARADARRLDAHQPAVAALAAWWRSTRPTSRPHGLGAALEDLLAPAAAQGIDATADVRRRRARRRRGGPRWCGGSPRRRCATPLRHSGARHLRVSARRRSGTACVLEVDRRRPRVRPAARGPTPRRFGLRGLASLVADGRRAPRGHSAPGRGTTVRLDGEDRSAPMSDEIRVVPRRRPRRRTPRARRAARAAPTTSRWSPPPPTASEAVEVVRGRTGRTSW